jgi:hypothetical protein
VLKKYKLKTKNSERTIPLHSALAAEGFLDSVAVLHDGSKLFPDYTEYKSLRRYARSTKGSASRSVTIASVTQSIPTSASVPILMVT